MLTINPNTRLLEELKQIFDNCECNMIVRGSFARGDQDFNDVDVAIYYVNSSQIPKELPIQFHGKKITYWKVPLDQLNSYYEICLRPSISLIETKILKITNREALEIIQNQKKKFYNERAEKFALSLLIDEECARRIYEHIPNQSYSTLKRQAGSKRTISRITWIIKSLYPQTVEMNTLDVINFLSKKSMPANIAKDCKSVLDMLNKRDTDQPNWTIKTQNINNWYQSSFKPSILKYLENYLSKELIENAMSTVDPKSFSSVLEKNFEYAYNLPEGPEKWLFYYGLSGNRQISQESLIKIYNEIKDNFAFNNIVRNLIANPRFPESYLSGELIQKNDLNEIAFKNRALLKEKIELDDTPCPKIISSLSQRGAEI